MRTFTCSHCRKDKETASHTPEIEAALLAEANEICRRHGEPEYPTIEAARKDCYEVCDECFKAFQAWENAL